MLNKEEHNHVNEIIARMSRFIAKNYPEGKTERDAHPKTIAIVKGEFIINNNLPNDLKKGIFSSPKTHKTIIRFSNANSKIQPDSKKDVRGIALKILGIDSNLPRDPRGEEKNTQDFLLMSSPTMPLGTIKQFRGVIIHTLDTSSLKALTWVIFNLKTYLKISKTKKKHYSIANIDFWSTSTFMFEDQIVKYKLTPTVPVNRKYTYNNTADFLSHRLTTLLQKEELCYDFCIQFYKKDSITPLDDMSIKWNEDINPFIRIAQLKIPKQRVKQQNKLSKIITYSIANSCFAHRATGKLNEARIIVYKQLAKLRKKRNKLPQFEATINDYDKL